MTWALVLGGGGVAGVAWHTGVLLGLERSGLAVTSADLLVGTSAGATVAAQIGAGTPLDVLFGRQVDPATLVDELLPPVSGTALVDRLLPVYAARVDDAERRRRLGAMALSTETVEESVRRRVIAARLVDHDWPERPLAVVACDAVTGERRVFDRSSGVDLVDAVTASCAVPGVWPPVTIDGARYVDGGIWSLASADLAGGYDRVLLLAPIVDAALDAEVAALGPDVRCVVVSPDAASQAAFGTDVLDPAIRDPSARAGLRQGPAEAGRVADLFAD